MADSDICQPCENKESVCELQDHPLNGVEKSPWEANASQELSDSASYYRALLEEHEKVKEELRCTKEESCRITAELQSEKERHRAEVDERECRISALVKEKCDIQNHNERVRNEFQHQLELLQRQCATANKEKEAIVVKFAQREHTTLKLEQQKESLEKKLSDFGRERDTLLLKIKTLNGEKSRACDMLDQKCAELLAVKREVTTLRNDLSSRDVSLRNNDAKLKEEKDINKEMRHRYDLLIQQVKDQKNEFDTKVKELQEMVKTYQTAETNKNILADEERMEQQAKLIIDKQKKEDELSHCKLLLKEVDSLKEVEAELKDENASLKSQIEVLTSDRAKLEDSLQKLQEQVTALQLQNSSSQLQLSELESMKLELDIEREQCKNLRSDVTRLTEVNGGLREEIALCSEKESEALVFSQKLTETNVQLQSDLLLADSKASECRSECDRLTLELEKLRAELSTLKEQLEAEIARRQMETQLLAAKLAEKTVESDSRKKNIDDLLGEIAIMKKKHAASVKEMSKELHRVRRKGEGVESLSNNSSGDAVSLGSRTSSNSSLNTAGLHPTDALRQAAPSPPHGHLIATPEENGHIFNFDDLEDKQQFFVDKILKLQRANARKGEKIDFLEEHVRTLTEEIRKKNRILTGYFMKEEAGGLTSETSDKAKIEMAKHGGVMASVYSSRVTDNSVSLELSLEINRKLQALLEDTLLKNITLKESLNTLGEEIARLSQDHQRLLKSKS